MRGFTVLRFYTFTKCMTRNRIRVQNTLKPGSGSMIRYTSTVGHVIGRRSSLYKTLFTSSPSNGAVGHVLYNVQQGHGLKPVLHVCVCACGLRV